MYFLYVFDSFSPFYAQELIAPIALFQRATGVTVKNIQKYVFFEQIACVLREIHLNHKQITDFALF